MKYVTVDVNWIEGLVAREEEAAKLLKQATDEIKRLRDNEPMSREQIAKELGVKPNTVDYYLQRGLLANRLGKRITVTTRGEFERWVASGMVNFHHSKDITPASAGVSTK